MKLSRTYALMIALAALALTAQGTSTTTTMSTSKSVSLKITIAPDNSDCTAKGGEVVTNTDGSKGCAMPKVCKVESTGGEAKCPMFKLAAHGSGPDICCCNNCQNSPHPKCSFCSDP